MQNTSRFLCSLGAALVLAVFALAGSGCSDKKVEGKPIRFYVQVDDAGAMGTKSRPARMPDGMVYFVKPDPVILERTVNSVELVRVANGRLALLFFLNDEGTGALYRTSVSNRGRFMILEYNGVAIAERQLEAPIGDGRYFTFVNLPEDELEELVLDIRANISKIQKARSSSFN